MERKFSNAKNVLCVVTYMEDMIKTFEEENMPEDLDKEEEKSILKKKILQLALTRYMDRLEKLNKT